MVDTNIILSILGILAVCACFSTRRYMLRRIEDRTFRVMQRLSTDASNLIADSQNIATNESYVTTGHLILTFIQKGYFTDDFYRLHFDEDVATKYLKKYSNQSVTNTSPRAGAWHFNARMKNVLRLADKEATLLSDEKVEPHHLLLGILLDGDGPGFQAFAQQGITYDDLVKVILE